MCPASETLRSGPPDWDARYAAAEGGLFGEEPCEYLREAMARSDVAPRSALMLADGDGRNGTWVARQGVAVTAVDLSAEATRRARARDAAEAVAAERIAADLTRWEPGERRWEMATLVFLQGPASLRKLAIERARAALAPGGWLVVEGFAKAQATGAMGPDDPDKLWSLDELADWTADLEPVEALAGRVRLDEGVRHQGPAAVIRLLARLPD